jgi:hypothetical protein
MLNSTEELPGANACLLSPVFCIPPDIEKGCQFATKMLGKT